MLSPSPEPYGILGIVYLVSSLFMQPLLFLMPTFLMADRFPRRDRFRMRCMRATILVAGFNLVISIAIMLGQTGGPLSGARYVLNFVVYSLYLIVLVPAAGSCFEMGFWDALFCATAGYTMQNIGSGLGEFLRILFQASTGSPLAELPAVVMSDLSVIATIVIYHYLFIRHLGELGSLGKDSRLMLGAAVGVILVVIAFDVVIRGLEREGAALGFLLALRVIHGTVSYFVLFAEYEMLYNVRLAGEVDAQMRLSAERERQYLLSRDTIAAVNRRVHDIRHKVARDLSEQDVAIDKETLKAVVRDISVFDTQVKTGNDALDTILTEKSLTCTRRGVTLSCIADGTALRHMTAADLYGLSSLLLDRAVEEVCDLDDRNLRSVSLTLRRVGELALLHVEYYAKDGGAYPVGELEEIVSRYGGTLNVSDRGKSRAIDAMLPIPNKWGAPLVHTE